MLYFTTKRDINGNRKTLIVNPETKTYKKDYNTSHNYDDYITITAADRNKLANQLENIGYTAI